MEGPALFQETQRFLKNPWALFALAAAALGCGAGLFTADALGNLLHPAGLLGLVVGGGVSLLLIVGGLHTFVRPDGLYVRLVPLTRQHRFEWAEIVSATACDYRPIRDYGGWGVRWSREGKAYNVYGSRGVKIELVDGRQILIGSQHADALAMAIASARGA